MHRLNTGGHKPLQVVGIRFRIHPAKVVAAAEAGLWSDRDQLHAGEPPVPALAETLGQQLSCVLGGFAAAEGDGIHAVVVDG